MSDVVFFDTNVLLDVLLRVSRSSGTAQRLGRSPRKDKFRRSFRRSVFSTFTTWCGAWRPGARPTVPYGECRPYFRCAGHPGGD